MKRWKVIAESRIENKESRDDELIKILLENRGIKTEKEINEFLNPKLSNITINNLTIDSKQLSKAVLRIKNAIKKEERIVVFGDYDVDGICGTAILWETLNSLHANVMPYIPHRIEEGYGLSIKGINNVITSSHPELGSGSRFRNKFGMTNNQVQDDSKENVKLIITVDNGIVANKAVEFANKQGIDVVITDHHVPSKDLPNALAIVHTTKLCGAGVAWMLSNVILNSFQDLGSSGSKMLKQDGYQTVTRQVQHDNERDNHLELVALATIADLVPLTGTNRTFVKFGLEHLRQTKRIGLLELFKEAGIDKSTIGVYEIGHIIAPRLNAMGRLEYAMDSLRLLCTNNKERAKKLAQLLGNTNKERQTLTIETVEHAKLIAQSAKRKAQSLLFVAHESYQQGVIGLVAGKLVEEFYKPTIVVSIGEKYSKASARSVSGFNIIEFIRSSSELLVDAGGHPMAAGFTVETAKLAMLEEELFKRSEELLNEELLTRTLKIDCEIPLDLVNENLYDEIQKLSPFGMGNPDPTFVSKDVVIEDMRLVGREGKHIKFVFLCHPEFILRQAQDGELAESISGSRLVEIPKSIRQAQDPEFTEGQVRNDKSNRIDGIAFGMGERASEFKIGDKVDVAYTIDENTWNGNKKLQLKIKDVEKVN